MNISLKEKLQDPSQYRKFRMSLVMDLTGFAGTFMERHQARHTSWPGSCDLVA